MIKARVRIVVAVVAVVLMGSAAAWIVIRNKSGASFISTTSQFSLVAPASSTVRVTVKDSSGKPTANKSVWLTSTDNNSISISDVTTRFPTNWGHQVNAVAYNQKSKNWLVSTSNNTSGSTFANQLFIFNGTIFTPIPGTLPTGITAMIQQITADPTVADRFYLAPFSGGLYRYDKGVFTDLSSKVPKPYGDTFYRINSLDSDVDDNNQPIIYIGGMATNAPHKPLFCVLRNTSADALGFSITDYSTQLIGFNGIANDIVLKFSHNTPAGVFVTSLNTFKNEPVVNYISSIEGSTITLTHPDGTVTYNPITVTDVSSQIPTSPIAIERQAPYWYGNVGDLFLPSFTTDPIGLHDSNNKYTRSTLTFPGLNQIVAATSPVTDVGFGPKFTIVTGNSPIVNGTSQALLYQINGSKVKKIPTGFSTPSTPKVLAWSTTSYGILVVTNSSGEDHLYKIIDDNARQITGGNVNDLAQSSAVNAGVASSMTNSDGNTTFTITPGITNISQLSAWTYDRNNEGGIVITPIQPAP